MKSLTKSTSLLFLAVLVFMAAGCKKDTDAPEITLIGDDVEIALYGAYTEQGATALDAEDGDLTLSIQITPTIDVNNLGQYNVTYSATDEAGNTGTKTRTVTVAMMPSNYDGSFSVTSTCSFPLSIGDTQTIVSSGSQITINPIYGSLGGSLSGTVSGQNITFSGETVGTNTVVGTGSISDDASIVTLNLTFTIPVAGDQTCTLTYDRN